MRVCVGGWSVVGSLVGVRCTYVWVGGVWGSSRYMCGCVDCGLVSGVCVVVLCIWGWSVGWCRV